VYVQRLDSNGYPQWTAGGVVLCNATGDQLSLSIVSDDAGGAIVAWGDTRSGGARIYAQRVSSNSAALWTSGGVLLCTAAPEQNFPAAVTDGAAGAIVAWLDTRSGDFDVYAQRVDASGARRARTQCAQPILVIDTIRSRAGPRIARGARRVRRGGAKGTAHRHFARRRGSHPDFIRRTRPARSPAPERRVLLSSHDQHRTAHPQDADSPLAGADGSRLDSVSMRPLDSVRSTPHAQVSRLEGESG